MSIQGDEIVGKILSGATTSKATCQIIGSAEKGIIKEGMLVIVRSSTKDGKRDILARVESITPIDESYEAGGFLTEAIRKGIDIPSDVSRKYEIAELDLLFELGGSYEIRFPPLAGDEVVLIRNVETLAKEIFGIKENNVIIEYGTLAGYENVPVLLDIEALPMHLAVFGITGSGKSFNVGALIEKLSNIKWKESDKEKIIHFPIIAIDPNGDYVDYWEHFITKGKLGMYPKVLRYVFTSSNVEYTLSHSAVKDPKHFLRLFNIDLNEFKNSPRELAEAIIVYYAGEISSNRELQASGLGAILKYMLDKGVISDLNALFTNNKLYRNLNEHVQRPPEGITLSAPTQQAILRQLDTFKRDIVDHYGLIDRTDEPFTSSIVDDLVNNGGMIVIDFTVIGAPGYPLHLKQFIVYYVAYILFKRFVEYKTSSGKQKSLLFILEEVQNYCPNLAEYKVGYSIARDILQQIATQGRKFGLCLCLITQRPSYVDQVIISMCNTFLIHRIAPGDELFVKRVTGGLPESLERKLTKLRAGDVIITGQAIKSGLPILARIRKNVDRIVQQKAGKVEIANGLPSAKLKEKEVGS